MNNLEISIKRITDYSELRKVARLRNQFWPEDGEFSLDEAKSTLRHGGITLGAFLNDQLVGYAYSFPGYEQGKIYLFLYNIAVLPAYQHQNIGKDLMLSLYQEALNMGYQEIIWTFEPLNSRNAYFYLHKLGSTISEYIVNCYQNKEDPLPLDRFVAHWDLTVRQPTTERSPKTIQEQALVLHPPLSIEKIDTKINSYQYLLLPVPTHFDALQQTPDIYTWREQTREIFTYLFQSGWEVFDLLRHPFNETSFHYYALRK